LIRFPAMTIEQIAEEVVPSRLVDEKHVVEIYRYLALKSGGTSSPCDTPYQHEPRRGRGLFRWDPARKSSKLKLQDGNTTILNSHRTWQSVVGDADLSDTRNSDFEIVLTEYSRRHGFDVVIGLVPSTFRLWDETNSTTKLVGFSGTPGWGFIVSTCQICTAGLGFGGVLFGGGGIVFAKGDRVGLRYDPYNARVDLFRNGTKLGTAFNDVRGPVRAAISLVNDQRVTLISKPGLGK